MRGVICALGMWLLTPQAAAPPGGKAVTMTISSSAFSEGETIPKRFTCDGPDVSPGLSFAGVPAGARSLALICDDPDAPVGNWVHWVLFDLPPSAPRLPEGVSKDREIKGGGRQGTNDFGRIGYGGPCPPRGPAHRYYFKLFALDVTLGLQPGVRKAEVLKAAKGHILAEAQVMGRYAR